MDPDLYLVLTDPDPGGPYMCVGGGGGSRTYITVFFEVAEALLRKAAGVDGGIHRDHVFTGGRKS
jgi:hypothetical protein